jgi:tRNA pseudouridine13 synthase
VLRVLRDATFPLLGPDTRITDPKIQEAVDWVLGKEKLTLEQLRIEEAPRLLFFKSEERPLLVFPHKLVVGRTQKDDLNRGNLKVNIAFTLPPGAYATLVIKRLFHFEYKEESAQQIRESWRAPVEDRDGQTADTAYAPRGPRKAPAATPPLQEAQGSSRRAPPSDGASARSARTPDRRTPAAEAPAPEQRGRTREAALAETRPSDPSPGFLERQRAKKQAKQQARQENAAKRPESRKKK